MKDLVLSRVTLELLCTWINIQWIKIVWCMLGCVLIFKRDTKFPKSFKIKLGYGTPIEIRIEIPWISHSCTHYTCFGYTSSICPIIVLLLGPNFFLELMGNMIGHKTYEEKNYVGERKRKINWQVEVFGLKLRRKK